MTTALIWLLTPFLILDCLFLGLLILVQLPKKEAGIGMAFGGGAADALFGAGSGTALTKLTKYSTVAFFVLVVMLSLLNMNGQHSNLGQKFDSLQPQGPAIPSMAPAATDTNAPMKLPIQTTNSGAMDLQLNAATNLPAGMNK